MSRCRATSFYVAPGQLRYFADHTVAARHPKTGAFVAFTHRRDIEQFTEAHPEWDGVCLIGPPGGIDHLHSTLLDAPEQVERWRLDARVVNGRAPAGPAHSLFQLARGGPAACGGTRQLAERLVPNANKALVRAVETACTRPDAAVLLAGALALRTRLGDDVAAAMLEAADAPVAGFAPVDPAELASAFDVIADRYGEQRARRLFMRLGKVTDWPTSWRSTLARRAVLSEAVGLALATDTREWVRVYLAANRTVTPEAAAVLAADASEVVRANLAGNPSITPEVAAVLATDTDGGVRANLAANRAITPELAVGLATDAAEMVGIYLARNPAIPPEVAAVLATDAGEVVRGHLARNPSITPEVAAVLVKDAAEGVLDSLARNPAITPEVAEVLATDATEGVRANLAGNPNITPEVAAVLATDANWRVRANLAGNPTIPPEVAAVLAKDAAEGVRANLAGNRTITPGVAAVLAMDADWEVRGHLARNPAITPELAVELATDAAEMVGIYLARNPAILPEVAAVLAENATARVRRGLATNPNITPEVAAVLAADADTEVRTNLAGNPNITPEVAAVLATDAGEVVRRTLARAEAVPVDVRMPLLAASDDPDDRALGAVLAAGADMDRRRAPDHPIVAHLREMLVVTAAERPEDIWPAKPKTLLDLPGRDVLPWSIDDAARRLDGTVVTCPASRSEATGPDSSADPALPDSAFTLRVLDSSRKLTTNANYMGNCTAGYALDIASGDLVIAALDDASGRTQYNVSFRPEGDGTWYVEEVNSRFNEGNVPGEVQRACEQLAESLGAENTQE